MVGEKGHGRETKKKVGVMKACSMVKVVNGRVVGEVEARRKSRQQFRGKDWCWSVNTGKRQLFSSLVL